MIKFFFFCENMSRAVFKEMLWNKITCIGMNLISCNKIADVSETATISKEIDNFF